MAATTTFDPLAALGAYDNLVSQGAEARVFATDYLQKATIIKQRFNKTYRHPILDNRLTKQRLTGEARSLMKARKLGVLVPVLYHVDMEMNSLYMERIPGRSVKEALLANELSEEEIKQVAHKIGKSVATVHDGGLVHGDLTTSNMLIRSPDSELVLIDFGLSYTSSLTEDKAVDLYVLERACLSAHSTCQNLWDEILNSYRKHSKQWSATFNKFAAVRMRGRKRTMVG